MGYLPYVGGRQSHLLGRCFCFGLLPMWLDRRIVYVGRLGFGHIHRRLSCSCRHSCKHHYALHVDISLSPCRHLAEAQSALAEMRVEQTSAQRNAKQHIATAVLNDILPLAMQHCLLYKLHAFVYAVARLGGHTLVISV